MVNVRISGLGNFSILLTTYAMVFLLTTVVVIFAPLQGCLPKCVGDRIHSRIIAGTLGTSSLIRTLRHRGHCVVGVRSVFDKGIGISAIRSVSSLAAVHARRLVGHSGRRSSFHQGCRRQRQTTTVTKASSRALPSLLFFHPAHKVIIGSFTPSHRRCKISVTTSISRDMLTTLSNAMVLIIRATSDKMLVRVRRRRGFVSMCGRYNPSQGGRNSRIGKKRMVTLTKASSRNGRISRIRFRL